MELNSTEIPGPSTSSVCPVCHQPTLSTYYFCPNCGAKLVSAPLPTTVGAQTKIYLFSLILPALCFLFVSHWQGVKYFKSADPKTKRIGEIAWILLILSTIITFWYAIVWTEQAAQSLSNSLNVDLSGINLQ